MAREVDRERCETATIEFGLECRPAPRSMPRAVYEDDHRRRIHVSVGHALIVTHRPEASAVEYQAAARELACEIDRRAGTITKLGEWRRRMSPV